MKAAHSEAGEQLLVEAAQRDPRHFAALYQAHFARVYTYIASRLRNRAETEDVCSQVFHQALAALPRFQWRGAPFAAWLLRIAANAVADHWQRAARERGNPMQGPAPEAASKSFDVEEADRRARLLQIVKKLPAEQRRVITARFLHEKSIREIAREMKKSEGAVKQLQFRALRTLRARMSGIDD